MQARKNNNPAGKQRQQRNIASARGARQAGVSGQRAKNPTRSVSVGAAVAFRPPKIGLNDLQAHRISWVCGYTLVGNGTLGTTDDIFFSPTGSSIVNGATGGGAVPILGADVSIGQTYVSDVEKHYARKRVRRCLLHLVPLQPSTANSAMVYCAPIRAAGASGDTVLVNTATAAPTVANTLGMAGVVKASSWESVTLDLTPYIAGGYGPQQNEFNISVDGASTAWGTGGTDLNGISPTAFVISGVNSTAALRATKLHLVVVEQVVDLIDFLGGNSLPTPLSFEAFERFMREKFGLDRPGAVKSAFLALDCPSETSRGPRSSNW